MRCQRQLAVDDDAKVASGLGDSDARAEHQDFLARDLVEQRAQAGIVCSISFHFNFSLL